MSGCRSALRAALFSFFVTMTAPALACEATVSASLSTLVVAPRQRAARVVICDGETKDCRRAQNLGGAYSLSVGNWAGPYIVSIETKVGDEFRRRDLCVAERPDATSAYGAALTVFVSGFVGLLSGLVVMFASARLARGKERDEKLSRWRVEQVELAERSARENRMLSYPAWPQSADEWVLVRVKHYRDQIITILNEQALSTSASSVSDAAHRIIVVLEAPRERPPNRAQRMLRISRVALHRARRSFRRRR